MNGYQSVVTSGSIKQLHSLLLLSQYSSFFVVCDRNTASFLPHIRHPLISLGHPVHTFVLPTGEEAKTIDSAIDCWNAMTQEGVDRSSCLIALGGGVVTDLAGFVAATYMRGIALINVPTTLLGMVDAAIGGKTAIDHAGNKNLIGSFKNPKLILIDSSLLSSLPAREIASGLAEVIKAAVIASPIFFDNLTQHASKILALQEPWLTQTIQQAIEIKEEIVANDYLDKGNRALLNFGHTFAHAIESTTHYTMFTHGEAVAIGMCCAANLSNLLGYATEHFLHSIETMCNQYGLPTLLPPLDSDKIIEKMYKDKKNRGEKITLVLGENIGKLFVAQGVDEQAIKQVLQQRTMSTTSYGQTLIKSVYK
ncbi:3-dehydroquinate synthase [Simkania negevensis]|uniref:3-dehydroquinate synthase n=1 Tax=Simkania negevensis TaxID=83561 RepID=A0ABS3AQE8_9BACT|nr:3-dehydroquinate synthase [Simkania negevensis]